MQIKNGKNHTQNDLQYSESVFIQKKSDSTRIIESRALSCARFFPPNEYSNALEPIQVVHYTKQGYSGCQFDNGDADEPDKKRVISIAIVLQTPKAGGELTFPAADEQWSQRFSSEMQQKCMQKCPSTETGITTLPKKGDAIFWYNIDAGRIKGSPPRLIIPQSANLYSTYHCDAEVTDGEKWIANVWLNLQPLSGGKKRRRTGKRRGRKERNGKRKGRRRKRSAKRKTRKDRRTEL